MNKKQTQMSRRARRYLNAISRGEVDLGQLCGKCNRTYGDHRVTDNCTEPMEKWEADAGMRNE